MSANVIRIGNYRLGKTIGKGSFGKVKLAEHEITGHKVAVKILNRQKIKNSQMDRKLRREIKILKLFKHPHIIRLYEVIETQTDIFMVMEYIPGGELFDYIVSHGRLSEDQARRFFQQIISGVEYCHRFMVVHRDLKPENLLLDSDTNVKVADFGLSNIMQDGDFLKTSCGSPNYAAPEVISGKLYAGPEVDVWSCGVILFALLCGRLPFDEESIPSLYRKIKEGRYTCPSHVSESARDLIARILVVDPLKRITIPEIRQHPWFQVNLPAYISQHPLHIEKETTTIDEEVLQEAVRKIGIDYDRAVDDIKNGKMNEITVSYFLLLDQKRKASLKEFAQNSPNTPTSYGSPPHHISLEVALKQRDKSLDDNMGRERDSESSSVASNIYTDETNFTMETTDITPIKWWQLGIRSNLPCMQIMLEAYKVLKSIEIEWKVLGPFHIKCRHGNTKFGLQIFKLPEGGFILDVRKLSGETMPFLDLCARLHDALRLVLDVVPM